MKSSRLKKIIAAVLICVFVIGLIIALPLMRFLIPGMRTDMDMLFRNYTTEHRYWRGSTAYYVPLPPKTVFAFRFSQTGSGYMTKTSIADVREFYERLAEPGADIAWKEDDNQISLSFYYGKDNVLVTIRPDSNSKNSYVAIDRDRP